MPLANFQDLCESLCALTGATPPRLVPDAHGTLAFTVTCEGIDVGFVSDDSGGEPAAMMVTRMGRVDAADELRVLRMLLEANFMVSGVHAPVFVRNPVTGDIAVHRGCVLARVDAQAVFGLVSQAVSAALQWRAGTLFKSPDSVTPLHFQARGAFSVA